MLPLKPKNPLLYLAHIWRYWIGQEVIGHVDEIEFTPRDPSL
jgi:hypothetical protein